ncbi:MAG: hypothetical protein NTY56_00630, partial [Patescibacteria group bacterium]|nr:hypothetical protein [Patescibacteria group bacterium]
MGVSSPGFGNGVQNIHSSKIEVPYGYRVNKVRLNLNTSPVTDVTPTTTADGKLTCTDTNNTGTCSIGTKVWNNNTTFVDWFLEKIPPTLTVNCTPDNGAIGGYITVTASSNIPLDSNPVAIK